MIRAFSVPQEVSVCKRQLLAATRGDRTGMAGAERQQDGWTLRTRWGPGVVSPLDS